MPSRLLVIRDMLAAHPATLAEYAALAQARAARAGREIVMDGRDAVAYVNDGRWVAECHHCGAAFMLDPDWPVAYCFGAGCYRRYDSIDWPTDRHAIEEALANRPLRNQHWGYLRGVARDIRVPAETLEDLSNDERERRSHTAHLRAR